MIKGTVTTIDGHRTLHCRTRTAEGAWNLVKAITRDLPFTTVTPTMIADGASPKYHTPLVLFAAPYQFELCQVRADGYAGLCILIIAIQEPTHHDIAAQYGTDLLPNALERDTAASFSRPLLVQETGGSREQENRAGRVHPV